MNARPALAIGLFAFVVALASVMPQLAENTWMFRDGRFYANVTTTLVEDQTLDQHRFAASWYSGAYGWNRDLDPGWSNVAMGRNGEHWPKHPYVLPFLASPLYFAFGLRATLLFNLLMFGFITAGLFRFARAYASGANAAIAACLFTFGSVVIQSAYDYSTDVLMLACVAHALAFVHDRKGAWAGLLIGLAVVIKPTALMLLPSLVLLSFERPLPKGPTHEKALTKRSLLASLGTGTVVLSLFALANTWMYGRPWWSGYNRTLVTAQGAPTLASHTDAFSVPFEEGFRRVMMGDYGLLAAFAILFASIPGLIALFRTRPKAALAALLGVTFSLLVFSRYVYEGHRFHWPALALLVPALASTLEMIRRALKRESFALGLAVMLGVLLTTMSLPRERLGYQQWSEAMLALFESALAPPTAAVALLILHALFAAFLTTAIVSLTRPTTLGERALRAVSVLALFGIQEVRAGLAESGPAVLALACLTWAFVIALQWQRRELKAPWMRALPFALALLAALATQLPHAEETPFFEHLAQLTTMRSGVRALLPVSLVAVLGIAASIARKEYVACTASLAFIALTTFTATYLGASPNTCTALLLLAMSPLVFEALAWVSKASGRLDKQALQAGGVALALALLSIGIARRVEAANARFQVASDAAVRSAIVTLDVNPYGPVPCDFLAWEHMSWECATFDRGTHGEAGLAIDEPAMLGGTVQPVFLLPTGPNAETRHVVWTHARAGEHLHLRWGTPDGHRGGGELIVRVNDIEVARVPIDEAPTGRLVDRAIPTPGLGEEARLELTIESRSPSIVVVDADW